MRLAHFHALRPVCPVCRGDRSVDSPLTIQHVARGNDHEILEGILSCSLADCRREYPILDGLPILVGPIRGYLADQQFGLLERRDLGGEVTGLLGDCFGPDSAANVLRQQRSSYVWDHYGEFDPEEAGEPRPGAIVRSLHAGLKHAASESRGPILDVGCGPGRTAFELAGGDSLVLGIDLNLSLLRSAAEVLQTGQVRYDRRRIGIVFDRRQFAARFAQAENVDFWACDAAALPFADRTFGRVVALNVLDATGSPVAVLREFDRSLADGGEAILTAPYDWSAAATPVENWLGGHSQRGEHRGDGAAILRGLLTPGTMPQSATRLKLIAEADDVPWGVRMHERSYVQYRNHLLVART